MGTAAVLFHDPLYVLHANGYTAQVQSGVTAQLPTDLGGADAFLARELQRGLVVPFRRQTSSRSTIYRRRAHRRPLAWHTAIC